jgi:YVTN family beta-propeller protein
MSGYRIQRPCRSALSASTGSADACRLTLLALGMAGAIALAAGPARATSPSAELVSGTVYTADERGNTISAIDLGSGRVESVRIPISPHNVQITADGGRLLAVGDYAHGHGAGAAMGGDGKGRLLVLDTATLARGPIAEIAVGAHPAHVVADRGGRRAFVTNAGDNSVSVVNLAAGAVVATIGTGRYPHGLRISPDGREIYVANVKDGSLTVIDTVRLVEAARIPVGKAPVQVGFLPDGSRVYVSLRDENRVAVIDTATRKVTGRIGVGSNPIQVHAVPDGRQVYVANQGTDADPSDTVSVIDTASGTVVDTIRTGNGAHGVAVDDTSAFVFVTNIADATVSMIDTAARKVIATFSVGRGPNGITYRGSREAGNRGKGGSQ